MIRFGPSGNSDDFYEEGYKHTYEEMRWLSQKGLNAFEYSFGRGVRISQPTAQKIREEAEKYDIALSVHAPYYINLATLDPEKREKNVGYILSSAQAAKMMGACRVELHVGSCANMDRSEAFHTVYTEFEKIIRLMDEQGLGDITLCPETMGKINQIGTLEEIVELCALDERLRPTVDFGHLYARTLGKTQGEEAFAAILDYMKDKLGEKRASTFHVHFSKIEYTGSGEKRHLTFESDTFGPDYHPLMRLLADRDLSPTIICESAGTMAGDALKMKLAYEEYKKA